MFWVRCFEEYRRFCTDKMTEKAYSYILLNSRPYLICLYKNHLNQCFSRNCRSTVKTFLGHVLGCEAGVFGESGSVNQCGPKGKVYGCKLNLNH